MMPQNILAQATAKALKPVPILSVSEWADQNRRLSVESSAIPGKWKTDTAPFQRAIMDAVTDDSIHTIVFMKSSQVGWTEILNNVLGYFIDCDPCPILIVQPTVEMAKSWSKDRLTPMLRDTPCLKGKVSEEKSRTNSNTIQHKKFNGGHLTVVGANSPAGLASRPIRVCVFDELDRFPLSAGMEGNPRKLASKRQTTYWNRKTLIGSTPTIKGISAIEAEFNESDMRFCHVPCPHCGHYQRLMWENLKWPEDKPGDAFYMCESCAASIGHEHKSGMLSKLKWIATKECSGVAGFFINELYSPWVTWAQMANNFLVSRKIPETLKTFVNTSLGETWEEKGEQVEENYLLSRVENYSAVVPREALFVVAGVDVQDDRFEVEVYAEGANRESWLIEYAVIAGNMNTPAPWNELDEFLKKTYTHESGHDIRISGAGIDSGGHFTQNVYRFCAARFSRRIVALKGMSGDRNIVSGPTRSNTEKCRLYSVGVDKLKNIIFSRLKIEKPGPGFCHFPAVITEDYFKQLTGEKLIPVMFKGRKYKRWVPKTSSQRVEALDCRVYAIAVMYLLRPDFNILRDKFAQKIENVVSKQIEKAESVKNADKPIVKSKADPFIHGLPRRGNFATGWK